MPRPRFLLIPITLLALGCASGYSTQAGNGAQSTYYAYVAAESADLIHRIRFGADGASLDKTIPVGELSVETEGPHALMISQGGEYLYLTTGHGFPDGKLWKFRAGPDTLVQAPILLGRFPATLDLTPDGLYAFVANFNLHGEKVPSTISVVYTPEMVEVAQIDTCTQPHGLRVGPRGTHLYTNCIQDDQLVELDTRTFKVSRRFSVAVGHEGSIPDGAYRPEDHMRPGQPKSPSCAPTWAEPSPGGSKVYVACNKGDTILEIDTRDWVLLRKLPTGRGIYNLDITPDGKMLVGTLKQGAGVEFFDLERWASVGIVRSSTTVTHGVAITPDSRFALVSVEGVGAEPGKVDIYDLRSLRRVGEVEVGQQAGGIVFWRMEKVDR
ncbi:MAG: YncE family protein [Longimicrobiales bacterium]